MAATRILVRDNGPLLVDGDFEIADGTGGARKACGFSAPAAARDLPPREA